MSELRADKLKEDSQVQIPQSWSDTDLGREATEEGKPEATEGEGKVLVEEVL